MGDTKKPARGPYRADGAALHHEDYAGFLFTVTPASYAEAVADALNAQYLAQAEALER